MSLLSRVVQSAKNTNNSSPVRSQICCWSDFKLFLNIYSIYIYTDSCWVQLSVFVFSLGENTVVKCTAILQKQFQTGPTNKAPKTWTGVHACFYKSENSLHINKCYTLLLSVLCIFGAQMAFSISNVHIKQKRFVRIVMQTTASRMRDAAKASAFRLSDKLEPFNVISVNDLSKWNDSIRIMRAIW